MFFPHDAEPERKEKGSNILWEGEKIREYTCEKRTDYVKQHIHICILKTLLSLDGDIFLGIVGGFQQFEYGAQSIADAEYKQRAKKQGTAGLRDARNDTVGSE